MVKMDTTHMVTTGAGGAMKSLVQMRAGSGAFDEEYTYIQHGGWVGEGSSE